MNDIMMSPGLIEMIAFEEAQPVDVECCVKFTTTTFKGTLGKFLVSRDKQNNVDALHVMFLFKKEQLCDAISCAQVAVETVELFKQRSCIFEFKNGVDSLGSVVYSQQCAIDAKDFSMLLSFEKKVL